MSDTVPTPDAPTSRVPRWAKWTVIGLIAAVVLFFGAIFLYAKVLNDSPDEFSAADIDARLEAAADATDAPAGSDPASTAVSTPTTAAAPATADAAGTTAPGVTAAAPAATAATATTAPAGATNWVATAGSEVGYRVKEVLFGVDTTAVGRTDQVTGSMTIEGTQVTATEFTIDVASITSDESRRDGQFRGRIMSADEFPTAGFVLTAPIELGVESAEGAEVAATATGELTLRGVTLPVTFEVNAKQQNGLIGVQGAIPVVFADYEIANPSTSGITTEDHGLVEFVLVFQPA